MTKVAKHTSTSIPVLMAMDTVELLKWFNSVELMLKVESSPANVE